MLGKTIALEKGQQNLKRALEESGFSTIEAEIPGSNNWLGADMIVITGQRENIMGMQYTETNAPVINAKGLTSEEIVNIAREKLQ
jgi:hypothetical protein